MFSNLFGNLQSYIQEFLFIIPVILISLPIHEFAHAMTATALGDPTAKRAGRLTLNPLAHLDPIGALCILIVHFGWAKPVPVNPNLMRNRKSGMALTAIAGPISNVILAFIFAGVLKIMTMMNLPQTSVIQAIGIIFYYFVLINIGLAIFNLIPIPPLDGSRILAFFLPPNLEMKFYQYEKYFYIAIIILLFTGFLTTPLTFLIRSILTGMSLLFRMNLV